MGGFEIFENRTIVKFVLIETVVWGDPLYFKTVGELISAWKSTFQNSDYFQNQNFLRFEINSIFFQFKPEKISSCEGIFVS